MPSLFDSCFYLYNHSWSFHLTKNKRNYQIDLLNYQPECLLASVLSHHSKPEKPRWPFPAPQCHCEESFCYHISFGGQNLYRQLYILINLADNSGFHHELESFYDNLYLRISEETTGATWSCEFKVFQLLVLFENFT